MRRSSSANWTSEFGDGKVTDNQGVKLATSRDQTFLVWRHLVDRVSLSMRGAQANATGKKDGEVIMIKNDDNVEAYQWQAADSTWQQIGQVVDAIGSGRKQLYEGKEYDHVFDVDVAEGVPPLKLPYNITG